MENQFRYQTFATVLAASILPGGMAIGTLTGAFLKLTNPQNVDVWQPLAYLAETMIASILSMAALLGLALFFIWLISQKEGTLVQSARLPIIVTVSSVTLILLLLAGQGLTRLAEDNWARVNDAPSREERNRQLEQFFSELSE